VREIKCQQDIESELATALVLVLALDGFGYAFGHGFCLPTVLHHTIHAQLFCNDKSH